MGCSPSKGNNFVTQGPFQRGIARLPTTRESPGESHSDDGESGSFSGAREMDGCITEKGSEERSLSGPIPLSQKEALTTPQKKRSSRTHLGPEGVILDKLRNQGTETETKGKDKQLDKQDGTDKKSERKAKKMKSVKTCKKKEKDKKCPVTEEKVDFPEPLVNAHQAAYAFLNPSITKYDILLGLLEQATQTQVSVQPMVAFMAMRYKEINQGLVEMAEEGEKLLKEKGDHLAWPSRMKNLSSSSFLKSSSANMESQPDLLQQLLQYTTQRMRNVGQAVGGIGDSALEEAVEYFASVSELLEEKLKAKRATEARLMQLLTRIESASLHKPGPEDSALFSEDSGIGAESESLHGSERRFRRESCDSSGTNRTTPCSPMGSSTKPVRQMTKKLKHKNKFSPSGSVNSIDSTCTIPSNGTKDTDSLIGSGSLDDGKQEDEDDEDEGEDELEKGDTGMRERSNSSPAEPNQTPGRMPPKRIENPQNVEMTLKMKDAISGRIQFVSSQHASARTKSTGSLKTCRQQWAEDEARTPKRPQTAAPTRKAEKKSLVAKERRSQSAESLRSRGEDATLFELERIQRDLSRRLENMSKVQTGGNTKSNSSKRSQGNTVKFPADHQIRPSLERTANSVPIKDKADILKHTAGDTQVSKDLNNEKKKKEKKIDNVPIKVTPPSSPPLSPRPSSGLHRGRNSVKKLIDTFSQGLEDQEGSKMLGPLKGVRKCGVPILPGLGNVEGVLSTGISRCRPEPADIDLESLPPPPLEVLLDDSFEGAQSLLASDSEDRAGGRSPVPRRSTITRRLRASMQSVTVLPSRNSVIHASRSMSPARAIRQPAPVHRRVSQSEAKPEVEHDNEEAASLYKHNHKIIHLRQAESPVGKSFADQFAAQPTLSQAGSSTVPLPPTSVVGSPSPPSSATPPVSRVRMLPTTPSAPSGVHRRLPSPNMIRRQPTPPSSTNPPVSLPIPPPLHRRLPSPPVVRREITPSPASTYSFKAPSPPASPKVQRRTSEKEEPSVSSRLISNVRSVFCPASRSLFEAQPCAVPRPPQAWTTSGVSVLPHPWGDRGTLPLSARGPRPFIRRSFSDRRPSLSLPFRASCNISVAQTCGSEPSISTQGLEDETNREDKLWSSQSYFRSSTRSASQPDLCIVGQALQRE